MKKFLLLIALIISGMGLFAQETSSATKGNADFWIEEENITPTSASFIIQGSIGEYYYYNVYTSVDFFNFRNDYDLIISTTLQTGYPGNSSKSFTVDNLNPRHDYVAVVVDVVNEYSATWADYEFSTLATYAGISINIDEVTESTVKYTVTPNSYTKEYRVDVLTKQWIDEFGSDFMIEYELESCDPKSDKQSLTKTDLDPDSEYVIVGIAVDDNNESSIVRVPFATNVILSEEDWWTIDYTDYSLDYMRISANECMVKGNAAPTQPTNINIPSEVSKDGRSYKVVQLYDNAFKSWEYAISFNLPTSIKKIGEYAFSECTSMDNLPIPESVEIIGANAFEKCSRLVTVNMSTTVKEIGEKAFFECKDLGTVTFANNSTINKIADNAFLDCSSLFKITIPGSVSEMGEGVFKNCTSLKDVTFGDNSMIANLKNSTFENCEKLKNVTFGENSSLTSINENLFSDCPNLESIVFGDNAKLGIIEENAFKDHTKLSKVAFGKNSVLHTIYDYSFQGCTSLTSIEIPSSINLLGRSAFEGCSALPSFVVPEGVKSLGNSNFKDCTSLKIFEISSTVTTIPNSVFSGCTSLSTLTCKATSVPTTGDEVFEGVPNSMVIRVYRESLPQYQSESPWNEYILKAIEDSDEPEEPGDEPEEPGDEPEEPGTLAAPKNVKAVVIDATTIELSWSPVSGVTHYDIYAVIDGEAGFVGSVLSSSTDCRIDGLIPGNEYCFQIGCSNENTGEKSKLSEEVCATISEEPGDEPEEPGDEPEEPGDEPEEPGDEPEEPGEGVEENVMIFAIYPNPVENNLTIDTDEVVTEINIYSITGVLVYSETSVSDNVINVSDLNNGIYFINIKTENGDVMKRFIKK